MAKDLNNNLRVQLAKHLDEKYGGDGGIYTNEAAALAAIPSFERVEGLTVLIREGASDRKEYWFDDNGDLQVKSITNNNQLLNGANYITASALAGYATETLVTTRGYITAASLPTNYVPDTGGTFSGFIGIGVTPTRAFEIVGASNLASIIKVTHTGANRILQMGANRDYQDAPYIGSGSNDDFYIVRNDVSHTRFHTGLLTTDPAQIGLWSAAAGYAFWGHKDFNTGGGYALLQASTGVTILNGVSNTSIRVNGGIVADVFNTGVVITGVLQWSGTATGNGSGITNVNALSLNGIGSAITDLGGGDALADVITKVNVILATMRTRNLIVT